ncbi:HupE / UreJ protein [Alteromonadaceae bacterium Bs31]|nr:HupE / UreJ protein [Alteromonadaceae bacterium Bs31]
MKLIIASLFVLLSAFCFADDSRPASLTIAPLAADTAANTHFEVIWKLPYKGKQIPKFSLDFDASTQAISPKQVSHESNTLVERWNIQRDQGLAGMQFSVNGLQGSNYQVLVRIPSRDGNTLTAVLNTEVTSFTIPEAQQLSSSNILLAYIILGFEHILAGLDHLLFVFALVLLIARFSLLLLTISSFTVAHSITLIAVSLGWMQVAGPPVEAAIALSIVFLARELISIEKGNKSLTATYPWLVAFSFGLLHGMGFAGALKDIGVPEEEAIAALLSFNIGVELGQLIFVLAALLVIKIIKYIPIPQWSRLLPAYGIGSVASIWLLQRLMNF